MLRPVHAATNGIRTSSPLARVGKLVASGVPAATQHVLANNNVSFTFETDPVTGVHLKSWKHTNGNTQNNHSTSLWALYINRAERFGNLRIAYPHDRYYRTVPLHPLLIPGGRKFIFEWVGVPVEEDVEMTVQVTATLMNSSSHVELSARILATEAGDLVLDNCIAGFQFLNLSLDGSTTDAASDVWSVPTQQGSSILDPVANLRAPRHDRDHRAATIGATKLFFGDPSFHAISPATDNYRAAVTHPGALSMPFVSFSNRISKDGTLIYASDPEGISAKVFYWWADGRYVHLRVHDQSDTEFHPHGVGRWNDGVALEDHTYEWTMRIRPYVSPTRWSDEYAAVLYEREGLDALTYLPAPLWQRAIDGDIDATVADTPFAVVGFGIGGVTGEETRLLLSGAVAWQDVYTGAVTGSVKPSLYLPVHTASFEQDGANMFWYGTGMSGESYGPDNSRLRDDYTGVADEILKSGLLPAMPYHVYRPLISSLPEWTTGTYTYDLITKLYENVGDPLFTIASKGNVAKTYDTELQYTGEFGNDGTAMCLFPDPCQARLSENMTGLAAAGVLSYRDTWGSWQFGCYAESHQYGSGQNKVVSPVHPRSIYSRYWNSLQTGLVGTWNTGIADMMNPSWGGTTTNNLGSISPTEYLGDSQLKYALGSIASSRWTDRTIYSSNSGDPDVRRGSYPFYSISPPVWLEAKSLFNMVHGARSRQYSILGHFGNATTATGAYYTEGDVLGFTGALMHVHTAGQDISKRHQDGRLNMTVRCLSLGTMFSVHNWSEHLTGNATADYTDMETDMQVFLTGDQYTGEVAYCKTWMQTVASAKQYHLDGNMMYGLERWESPLGYATQDEEVLVKVSAKYHSGVTGEQKILHNVRKHRSTSDAYLLTAFNWASGAETYTGVFDPVAYEMYGAYTVYSIDHTGAYGQRSWVATVPPRQTYELTETLPGKAASLWEFTSKSAIIGGTVPCDLKVATINVRYSYGKKLLYTTTLGIGYSYGAKCYTSIDSPHVGYKAAATQSIVNNLPQWMDIRRSEASKGWEFINAYGMAVESVTDVISNNLRNLFLSTADRHSRHKYYKGELTIDELFEDVTSRNLLINSSFSKPDVARTRLPLEWTDYHKPTTQTVFLDSTRVLRGTYSSRVDGVGTISQILDLAGEGPIDKLTASVYFFTNLDSPEVSLVLAVQDMAGVSYLGEKKTTSTVKGWQRLEVTVEVAEEVFEAQVTLRGNSSSSVWFDCVQLEAADKSSDWQVSDLDKLLYVDGAIPIRLVEARSNTDRVTVYPISDLREFTRISIPTRVAAAKPESIDLEPFSSAAYSRRVNFFNDVTNIKWIINAGQVVSTDTNNQFEVFERYDIRDLRSFQGQGYGTIADCLVEMTPLAVAMREDLLFVACKEVYRGRTVRTLKVVVPRRPPNDETYLESLVDFELPLTFGTVYGSAEQGEDISSIGFSERDPSWLIVNTSLGRRFYFRMYYDYYFANMQTRAIYTLERYDNAQLQVT